MRLFARPLFALASLLLLLISCVPFASAQAIGEARRRRTPFWRC